MDKQIIIQYMNCVICNSDRTKFIYSEQNPIFGKLRNFNCLDCGVIFCRDMDEVVSPDYVDVEINEEHIWLQSDHKKRAFNQFLTVLEKHQVRPDLVLDYGCGTGGFLRYLINRDTSLSYFGSDFSQKEISTAGNLDKIASYTVAESIGGAIGKVDFTDKITIVTMWDVLEHIRRPVQFCEELKTFKYVYISVPSAEFQLLKFTLSRLLGIKPYFMSHEHVTYFSRKSLKLLFESLGFSCLEQINIEIYERKSKSLKNILRKCTYNILSSIGLPPQIGILAIRRK